jgi:YVTN family beta-propeller protein
MKHRLLSTLLVLASGVAGSAFAAPQSDDAASRLNGKETAMPRNADVAPASESSPGAQVYAQQCAACHQANGQGIPGAFPPQRGHAAELYNADQGIGGRSYLSRALLYGLTGPISVEGTAYNGNMPAWSGALSHQQTAEVLNYVLTAFGNNTQLPADYTPYTAQDIEAEAGKPLSGKEVHQLRLALMGEEDAASTPASEALTAQAAKAPSVTLEEAVPAPIYVAVQNSGNVKVLPSKAAWPGVEGAHYDALSPDGRQLLVSGFKTGNVYVMDTQDGDVMGSIAIGEVAQGVKISPDGRYGLAIAPQQGVAAVIDLSTLELVKKIDVGDTPHNAIFSADGSLAYVTLQGQGAIAVIDMQTLEKRREIATPGLDTPHNIDLSEDGRSLWLRDFVGNVGVLDLESDEMLKTFKVGNGHGGIDVIPGGQYVATGAISDSRVTFIDLNKLEIVANVEVGTGPHGVRASADGRYLYASLTADNSVAVIDTRSLKVVRQEPVGGDFPFWIAVPGNP